MPHQAVRLSERLTAHMVATVPQVRRTGPDAPCGGAARNGSDRAGRAGRAPWCR
ncbi:hypothetical protein [Streptomyces sp. enrichment culture]|uniref:hypothetical protein n=1 Tax=Streptomyces sp. enrichment culture TaxID=1795815 RepID=UPI003F567277